jgi:hypothetical protein
MSVYDESDIYREVSLAVAPGLCTVLRHDSSGGGGHCSLTVLLELPIFVVYIGHDVRIGRDGRGGTYPGGTLGES